MPSYFDQILRVTQHVIVDSARFTATRSALSALGRSVREVWCAYSYSSDLNWARATPWREILAQCFDSPESRPLPLPGLGEVRIEYEGESARLSTQRSISMLLTAWLATRLGWKFQHSESKGEKMPRVLFFRDSRAGMEVKVERTLRTVESGGRGVCFSLVIEADGARFLFSRGEQTE